MIDEILQPIDEMALELSRINAISSEHELVEKVIEFSRRRQMDSAKHGALIGFAFIRASELGFIPKGKEEFKQYCLDSFGYKPSQMRQFRTLAAEYHRTVAAQTFIMGHRHAIQEVDPDIKMPEIGSTSLAVKALKSMDAHEQALGQGLDRGEAISRAAEVFQRKVDPSLDNKIPARYKMLTGMFAVLMKRYPKAVRDMDALVGDCPYHSMATLDEWLKQCHYDAEEFVNEQYEVPFKDLSIPWYEEEYEEPKRATKTGARKKTKTESTSEPKPEFKTAENKAAFLILVGAGMSKRAAAQELKLGKGAAWYWEQHDPAFKASMEAAMAAVSNS